MPTAVRSSGSLIHARGDDGQPPNGSGFVHRGVAAWRDHSAGDALRIFINSRYHLICLDAATGRPIERFGSHGIVDLSAGLVWAINKKHYTNTSPPVVYKDLVILGNGVGDRLAYKNDPPGDVRAFDARTGRQVWTFHTVPQPGDTATTWKSDSWAFVDINVWAPMTLVAPRGRGMLPVTTPSNDFYRDAAPARTCSPSRSSASTRTRAFGSGTISSSIMGCGTTTIRRRPTW
jgi:quinoprotein glucose dehydrogenase